MLTLTHEQVIELQEAIANVVILRTTIITAENRESIRSLCEEYNQSVREINNIISSEVYSATLNLLLDEDNIEY